MHETSGATATHDRPPAETAAADVVAGGRAGARFTIRLQRALWPILLLFGVRRGSAFVNIDGDRVEARFGFYGAETTLANIKNWDLTGPYRWWSAVGVRATLGKRELTFGGSAHGGLCLHFREPVRIARLSIADLYLTVDDLEGLGAALRDRGIPGQDLRRGR